MASTLARTRTEVARKDKEDAGEYARSRDRFTGASAMGAGMSEGWLLTGADEERIADPVADPFADPMADPLWRSAAACQSTSPDLFFPVGVTGTALVEIAAAKFVCSQCTVREPCLDYALATNQEYGIWGGFSEEDRRVIRRRRRQAGGRAANVPAAVPPGDAG